MVLNAITEEIREIRHLLAAVFDNDVYRIGAEIRRRQRESGRQYHRLPSRSPLLPNTTNQPMHGSGEVPFGRVEIPSSPPRDR